jgi:hypothetical protein
MMTRSMLAMIFDAVAATSIAIEPLPMFTDVNLGNQLLTPLRSTGRLSMTLLKWHDFISFSSIVKTVKV